jgi:hypothetical protein
MALLKKYQKGNTLVSPSDSKEYLEGWFNSPKHKELLLNSLSKDFPNLNKEELQLKADEIITERLKNLNDFETNEPPILSNVLGEANPSPNYYEGKRNVTLFTNMPDYNPYVKTHEYRHMSNSNETGHTFPKYDYQKWQIATPEKMPEAKAIIFDYNNPYKAYELFKDTKLAQNAKLKYEQENNFFMSMPYEDFLKTDQGKQHIINNLKELNYLGRLEEISARKDAILQFAKDNNIFDPYTETMTPEILEKIKAKMKGINGRNQLEQLEQRFNDNDLLEIFNTIANTNNKNKIMMARKGGILYIKKYQNGTSPVTYTYPSRPGVRYQKGAFGWMINIPGKTNGYVPIKDPDGKRAAELNKNAIPAQEEDVKNKIYEDNLRNNKPGTEKIELSNNTTLLDMFSIPQNMMMSAFTNNKHLTPSSYLQSKGINNPVTNTIADVMIDPVAVMALKYPIKKAKQPTLLSVEKPQSFNSVRLGMPRNLDEFNQLKEATRLREKSARDLMKKSIETNSNYKDRFIKTTIEEGFEPYISRRTNPVSREQEVLDNTLGADSRVIDFFDSKGNIIKQIKNGKIIYQKQN